jgi:dCMP deaminase
MVTIVLLGNRRERQMIASCLCEHFAFKYVQVLDSKHLTTELQHLDISKDTMRIERSGLLHTLTTRWKESFVLESESESDDLESLGKRPFVLIMGVVTLTEGVSVKFMKCMHSLAHLVLCIKDEAGLPEQLASIDFCNPKWLRPSWDTYFMQMAYLASSRSNCMKRRVGAILVNDNRVIATGYNGTATGTLNCSQDGCARCNSNTRCGVDLGTCLCLHAEENAILEAGRSKAQGGTLYCTLTPCLGCARKIVQVGVARMVYDSEYNSSEHDSVTYLMNAGIAVERHAPHHRPCFINM